MRTAMQGPCQLSGCWLRGRDSSEQPGCLQGPGAALTSRHILPHQQCTLELAPGAVREAHPTHLPCLSSCFTTRSSAAVALNSLQGWDRARLSRGRWGPGDAPHDACNPRGVANRASGPRQKTAGG